MYDDNLIKSTFENKMNKSVRSISKFMNVTNNIVYKIETEAENFIFKIYNKRDWPENGKLLYITHKFIENNIPHAKLFTFNREDSNYPNGYLIEECLAGTTADKIRLSNSETFSLFKNLAELTSRIHQIKMINYGYIGGGEPASWTSFSEYMYDVLNDNIENIMKNGIINSENELIKINKYIYEKIKCCDIYPPVLCHGDLSIKNVINNNNSVTLIDWDDAQSLCWIADIARLTLWMKMNYDESLSGMCRKVFLENYKTVHDMDIFYETEELLHIWYGLDNLTFFKDGYMREKAHKLLEDSRKKCKI